MVYANRGVVERVREDYPAAMKNAVYDLLEDEEVCVCVHAFLTRLVLVLLSSYEPFLAVRGCGLRYARHVFSFEKVASRASSASSSSASS